MSDKWETVGPSKKVKKVKPPKPIPGSGSGSGLGPGQGQIVGNGQVQLGQGQGQSLPVKQKVKKHSAKVPASFPLGEVGQEKTENIVPAPAFKEQQSQSQKPKKQDKKLAKPIDKPREKKRDLEWTLTHQVSTSELLSFFKQLELVGTTTLDIRLSWIKYCADALNTKLSSILPPDPSQFPNDLKFPFLPSELEEGLTKIIIQTGDYDGDIDVLGISYTSLLACIPTLVQRGDAGWGHLLFLRQLMWLDPTLPIRRHKTFHDLMESYGNRKEIGLCVLWTVAQAGLASGSLKIVSDYLLPYHGFKHYKNFVLSAVLEIVENMPTSGAGDYVMEGEEFEEFFEAAWDPKKRKDLEKIYPRVKDLALKSIKGQGGPLFLQFMQKAAKPEFNIVSPYGQEVFSVMLGCLENDPEVVDTWRENIGRFPKESVAFLSYLSKVPESIKCGSRLESKLIQSDEFALAAARNHELLRYGKKVQASLERVALSKRRFCSCSWKFAVFMLLLVIGGLLWLDVAENGKGSFEKSNTAKVLEYYGLKHQGIFLWEFIGSGLKYLQDYLSVLFRGLYERIQPMLQAMMKKLQEYIPQLYEYMAIIGAGLVDITTGFVHFLKTTVFVGSLSPENLRKLTKEALAFLWNNFLMLMEKLYGLVEQYVMP